MHPIVKQAALTFRVFKTELKKNKNIAISIRANNEFIISRNETYDLPFKVRKFEIKSSVIFINRILEMQ